MMNHVTTLAIIIVGLDGVYGVNDGKMSPLSQESPDTERNVTTPANDSNVHHVATCSQQCSEQDLSYCTGFSYPLEDDLKLSVSCNTRDQHGRDRYVANYIDSAIAGRWKNVTPVFQELLMRMSRGKKKFPDEYFAPETAVISVLEGHRMSNTCNIQYQPLKELICSWLFVSPCHPDFKICLESCTSLMEECFPSALRDPTSRDVLSFICNVMSGNNTDCYVPEDVYREDVMSWRDSDKNRKSDFITIISASAGAFILLITVFFLFAAVRYYLRNQGYMTSESALKLDVIDPMMERARHFLGKNDILTGMRSSNRSIGDHGTAASVKKQSFIMTQLMDPNNSDLSLDQLDSHSLNSSASTFYCQTDQSVSTIGEVLPPETIYFEGVLSSRWKSSEDEVIALVSWIDGIGNKKKGVIKSYTDKKRKYMEDELNVISVLSHENVCEYLWRSMGNRPHVRGMSPHIQSVMNVRNNYFCTEYYSYGSLKDFLISRGHFLKENIAHSFFRDIVAGMTYLHDLEVFHRDLKTANILVGNRQSKAGTCPFRLVISDFGHSQEKHRQDCYVRDGSGGTSQYTAPEVLLSNGAEMINLYKADVYSMSLVSWEILSYVCCKGNDVNMKYEGGHKSTERCQIQNHTAFGSYLLNRFPDISSTSTSSSVVRDYMRNMYRNNIHYRPALPERWSTVSPTVKTLVMLTRKMWQTDPLERISTHQLSRIFNLTSSRLSLNSSKRSSSVRTTLSSVLCMHNPPT